MKLFLPTAFVTALTLLVASCSNIGPTPGAKKADPIYGIQISSGDHQTGNANGTLGSALVVTVTDKATGQLVSNAAVTWSVVTGGGHFTTQYTHTSPIGEAPAILILGAAAGLNTATATVGTGDAVTFNETGIIGTAASGNSSITGSGPIEPDGINFSTVTITLKDSSNNPVIGVTPTFSATGSANTYGVCSASSSSGISTCTLKSTTAETKILSITSPASKVGGTVVFVPGAVAATYSTITGTGPVVSNGVATSTVTVTLKDASNVGVAGVVPSFSATNTGVGNTLGICSSTNASGVSSCTLSSTHAELKTLAISSPVSVTGGTVSFISGPVSSSTSTINGSGPIENDGLAKSIVTILLKDANSNPVSGSVPAFSATNTGSTNSYGACSSSDATGTSTCNLGSTTAETKTLSLLIPVAVSGGTVIFGPGSVVAANSSISGSGPVVADGVATSTITITLRDAANIGVSGVMPNFTATDTSAKNNYGTCSTTNASGLATCTLTSTKAETKTLTLSSPVSKVGGSVLFNPGAPSALTSTITGTGSGTVIADGSGQSTVTITLKDAFSNPLSSVTPSFSATDGGTTNTYGGCSLGNASGVSTCTLSSLRAEVKTLLIATPVNTAGSTVTFIHGPAASTYTTITGSGPVPPDGTSTSTITVTLKDAFNNPVNAVTPTFSGTNTSATNVYGACGSSNNFGVSTCTLASSYAETKTLSLTGPVAFNGSTVIFAAGAASGTNSTITGTGSVVANGSATSAITIILKDSSNIAIVGIVPTFTATNTGNANIYGTCSATNSSGISNCSLSSTKAEVKTLSIASPINKSGAAVTFVGGIVSASTSQITGTSSKVADGVATSAVTVVLYDAYNNPVGGTTPSFSATNTSGGNTYGTCSVSSATGSSACTLSSTKAEVKTLSIATPVSVSGGTVTFIHGAAAAAYTTITGSGPTVADGSSASTVTITIEDANNNPVNGITPSFSATNTGNTNGYGVCGVSNTLGISTCTLTSALAETKSLSVTSPVVKLGGSVVFTAGAASAANSTISGTGSVVANGTLTSTITIILKDASNIAIVGTLPTFSATNSANGNTYGTCSLSDGGGISNCTLASTKAEVKTLSLVSPVVKTGGTVTFIAGAPAAANSNITGTGPVPADGTATSTITIVLYDANNNPVAGTTPSFSATNTGSTNVPGACSVSSASGSSTCTLSSTTVEVKTLSISAPVVKTGGTVNFYSTAPSALTSSITGTGSVNADGVASSTITITLKDGSNTPIVGTVPTFSATNTSNGNVYTTCSATNASGVSTCTLKSTKAEVKTLSIVAPLAMSGGTVTFNQAVDAGSCSIAGSGPVGADGAATSTVTVTIRDYSNTAMVGITPTFNATNTGSFNTYGGCSSTNASGIATCSLASTEAETKTLSLVTPVAITGNNVVFTQVALATYSTITGTGPNLANGVSTATITITLRDHTNIAIAGITPSFDVTQPGNQNYYGSCSVTNASGVSTCTMASGKSEVKNLRVTSPIIFIGGTVQFI